MASSKKKNFKAILIIIASLALFNLLFDFPIIAEPKYSKNTKNTNEEREYEEHGKESKDQEVNHEEQEVVYKELINLGIKPILPDPGSINMTNFSEWKYNLYSRLDRIQLKCGALCQLNSLPDILNHTVENEGLVLPTVVVPNVDCVTILSMEDIDAGDMTFPPLIPEELNDYYTLSNAYHIRQGKDKVRKDAYLGTDAESKFWPTGNTWNEDDINDAITQVGEKTHAGPYGLDETIALTQHLSQIDMEGKSVLVIGSSHPWVEVICLFHGAKKVTTLEYGTIISNHPQIFTETPSTFREKYLSGELEQYDGIVTHSSVEHSGLGRYGDALNPWGDILAIARAWCVTKPGGFMWVAVPTGRDFVFYNWHRVYGKVRWPLLTTNWKQVGQEQSFNIETDFERGPWLSMENLGFIFEKIDPDEYKEELL